MKMAIWISLFLLISSTSIMAQETVECTNIEMTPSRFYNLTGRKQCYDTIQAGCSCTINDGERKFPINPPPALPPNCKPSVITFENPTPDLSARIQFTVCVEPRGEETPPADTVTPVEEIIPLPEETNP